MYCLIFEMLKTELKRSIQPNKLDLYLERKNIIKALFIYHIKLIFVYNLKYSFYDFFG
jgi:hypothetical protein